MPSSLTVTHVEAQAAMGGGSVGLGRCQGRQRDGAGLEAHVGDVLAPGELANACLLLLEVPHVRHLAFLAGFAHGVKCF